MSAVRPLTVGIVGAGRVGAVLGAALNAAGHHVVAAAAVSAASRARAARLLPGAAILPADEVARAAADLLLLAVPDDALRAVVAGLATTGALRPGQVIAHTSGAHGLAVLGDISGMPANGRAPHGLVRSEPAVPKTPPDGPTSHGSAASGSAASGSAASGSAGPGKGLRGMALHPAMTFTGADSDLDRLPGIAWGVTTNDRVFATRLVADLGGVPEWVAEENRPLYHAALAHGANHLVTLVNEAADLLRAAGVEHPARVLAPLLNAALDNALRLGDAALTGPVSRGDAGTVGKHLDRLPPESVPAYLALARRTADRAIAAGRLRPQDATLLMDVLSRAAVGSSL